MLVLERLEVHNFVTRYVEPIPESVFLYGCRWYFQQIMIALDYLHRKV